MSALWMAAWAPTPRTSCGTAGISTSAAPTACLLTSWPWWWTMPGWALPRWCGEPTCSPPRPGSSICTVCWGSKRPALPTARCCWPRMAAASPSGMATRGDRGQAGLCVWPAARACSPHTGEPRYRFQLGECAQRRYLPAGKFILTKNACSLAGAGVFG